MYRSHTAYQSQRAACAGAGRLMLMITASMQLSCIHAVEMGDSSLVANAKKDTAKHTSILFAVLV